MKEINNEPVNKIMNGIEQAHTQKESLLSSAEMLSSNDEDVSNEQKELQKALKKTRYFKLRARERAKMREEKLHAPHLVPEHAFEE